ncbi:hypothetical protein HDF16_000143 [Granulicella aggregans]|uniref:Uncharacterized protein n=1 Tax=Granulicella aggregans TaxID=474949 RepID=A0A7W8E1T3_9BACT|nr:hypothetical protein [Granulicella aggregans]
MVERSLSVAASRMAVVVAAQPPSQGQNNPAGLGAGAGAGTGNSAPTPTAVANATEIPYVGGSASSTPTTCGTGSSSPAVSLIRVHREILTPDTAEDDFGYRLGRRFAVYQVTVENLSPDFQYMLQDVSIDFSPYLSPAGTPGSYRFSASGQDLTLLRGVPEKGQDYDPRNRYLHIFQGIGSVAAGISGLTSFSDVMGSAVAQFNGPFINAYTNMLPDHTATQLNRLSDSAFITNTIINKKSSKAIAMFIPLDEVMNRGDQKQYLRDPFEYAGLTGGVNMLYTADVCVDGTFIQTAIPAPALSTATVPKGSKPDTTVTMTLTGTDIAQGDTQVVLGGTKSFVFGTVTTSDGKTASAMVHLPADYVPGTTTATLRSSSNPTLTSSTPVMITEQQ